MVHSSKKKKKKKEEGATTFGNPELTSKVVAILLQTKGAFCGLSGHCPQCLWPIYYPSCLLPVSGMRQEAETVTSFFITVSPGLGTGTGPQSGLSKDLLNE